MKPLFCQYPQTTATDPFPIDDQRRQGNEESAFGTQAWLETYMDWICRAVVRFHYERLSEAQSPPIAL